MIHLHHHCGELVINRQKITNNASPLKMDPTRTLSIRKKFIAEMLRRFRKLKASVKDFLDTKDALGLKEYTTRLVLHAGVREFQFHTDPQKLTAFNDWLRQQIQADVLSVSSGADPTVPWTAEYITSAYKMGQINSYMASKEGLGMELEGIGDQTKEQFLRSSFAAPETMNKVQLLATRSFEQLKGVTASMGSQMNHILAQGMVDGTGPSQLAKEMTEAIDSLTQTRALTIARTETINAHSEGQLDAYEKLGIDELGVKAEWSTAGDDRVCEECAAMEGEVFDVEEARGLIPLHPNCRCAWIPFTGSKAELAQRAADQARVQGGLSEEDARLLPTKEELDADLVRALAERDAIKRQLAEAPSEQETALRGLLEEKERDVRLAKRALRRHKKREIKAGPGPKPPEPVAVRTTEVPAPAKVPAPVEVPVPKALSTAEEHRVALLKVVEGKDFRELQTSITDLKSETESFQKRISELWKKDRELRAQLEAMSVDAPERGQLIRERAAAEQERTDLSVQHNANWREIEKKERALNAKMAAEGRAFLQEKESLADTVAAEFKDVPTEEAKAMKEVLKWMPKNQYAAREMRDIANLTLERAASKESWGGLYQSGLGRIKLKPHSNDIVTVHEFGHHISYKVERIMEDQNRFFLRRTVGESVKRLPGYGKDVVGKKDKWGTVNVYAGRVYENGRHTEVISVGIEELYKNPIAFAQKDPEWFNLIVSTLKNIDTGT